MTGSLSAFKGHIILRFALHRTFWLLTTAERLCMDAKATSLLQSLHCQILKFMEGELIRYSPTSEHVAFVSGKHPRHVILIAGLTEGLLALSYSKPLSKALDGLGWSLVQIQVASTFQTARPFMTYILKA
jgi:hypothetical protein